MSELHHLDAAGAPRPDGSFSHAVAAGPFMFVSGQGPFHPTTGEIVGDDIETQTRQVIANLRAILAAADLTLADVAYVDAHLADFALFEHYDAIYRNEFTEPRPARKTVASGLGGILVEISCIAVHRAT